MDGKGETPAREFVVELAASRVVHAKVPVRAHSKRDAEAEVRRRFLDEESPEPLGDLDWKAGDLDYRDVLVVDVTATAGRP